MGLRAIPNQPTNPPLRQGKGPGRPPATCIPGLQLSGELCQALLQALALVGERLVCRAQLRSVRLARPRQLLGIVLPRGGELGLLGQLLPLGGHAGQLVADHLQAQGPGNRQGWGQPTRALL